MPFVDGQVDRLADGAAGVMQRGRHVGEFHEITEVLDLRVAAALVQAAYEGGAIGRRENCAIAADDNRAGRIARVLGELLGGGASDDGPAKTARKADALALDV